MTLEDVLTKWEETARFDDRLANEHREAHPGLASMLMAEAYRTRVIILDIREQLARVAVPHGDKE